MTSDLAITSPQVKVEIDRDKAAAMQINANSIEDAFYDAYGPRWVSTIYAAVNQYKVLLELKPQFQADPRSLSLLYFKSPGGNLVPLDTLATITQEVGPQAINHYGQLPAVTISFNLAPGTSLGDVFTKIEDIAHNNIPDGVSFAWEGAAKAFQGSLGNLWVLLLVAVLVVYIVLGILYESYIHPLTILSGLPSAGFGALMTLYLFHMDLNIYAFVGLIMLIGIVEKNAIMQIDFALDAERNQGLEPTEAIYQGLPDPLPADHDDHHGGAVRRGADRAGLRRGRRSPAAAGTGGGRRSDVLAVGHAVPDAGVLHLHGGLADALGRTKKKRKILRADAASRRWGLGPFKTLAEALRRKGSPGAPQFAMHQPQ